jgi:signal peptide peptidase SppA
MTESYSHVVRFVQETPWAILPATLDTIVEVLQLRARGDRFSPDEIRQRVGAQRPADPAPKLTGDIAVLPLHGILSQRMNLMTAMSGGTSTEKFTGLFQAAVADPAVGVIVLDVDSPGGSVFGIPELSDVLAKQRGGKPVVAVANSLAASAAYWIASQADELVVTPSGQVGSIGVIRTHEDLTGMAAQQGVKVTYITAGKFKAEDAAFRPLTDEAQAAMQRQVNAYYDLFAKAVARGREVSPADVRGGFGEGRAVGAAEALKLDMVDRIETLPQALARLQTPGAIVQLRASARLRALERSDPAAALQARRERARAARSVPVVLPVIERPASVVAAVAPAPPPPDTLPTGWRPR